MKTSKLTELKIRLKHINFTVLLPLFYVKNDNVDFKVKNVHSLIDFLNYQNFSI